MKKIREAWDLMKACWTVLRLDKELLLYPVLSALVLILFFGALASSFFVGDDIPARFDNLMLTLEAAPEWQLILLAFVFYFITSFIIVFFNAALIASVKIRLGGGDPKLMDGLQIAVTLIPHIAAWALVSATVGVVLDQLQNRSKGLAKWLVAALGAAWSVAVYFVVPVLVSERTGPVKAIKRSVALIRKSWGEALISVVGFSAIGGLIGFAAVLVAIVCAVSFEFAPAITYILAPLLIPAVITAILILTTLGSVLRAVLYVYATQGSIPPNFDQSRIDSVFSDKPGDQN